MTATMEPGNKVTSPKLDSKVPDTSDIANMWENHKFSMNLVNPNNKRKFTAVSYTHLTLPTTPYV